MKQHLGTASFMLVMSEFQIHNLHENLQECMGTFTVPMHSFT
jgi:hypothetical protein